MSNSKEQRLDEQHRLLSMREFLRVRAHPHEDSFEAEVVEAAVNKVRATIESHSTSTGEVIVAAIAKKIGVRFEEVRSLKDIQALEQKYLVGQRELGFGMLEKELADPSVDALLFQRVNAAHDAPDRWVAVVNLQQTQARAYWSRPHEILHRLAEPPQGRLPFFRHRTDHRSRVEHIVDLGAAELAFPQVAFAPRVLEVARSDLTWDLVKSIRSQFAPTSSLLSAAKAFLRFWPNPAYLLSARVRGRRALPRRDVALRIDIEGFTPSAASSNVLFVSNMRVPLTSPISHAHRDSCGTTDHEDLERWTTSSGYTLPRRRAFTSAISLGDVVYGIVSLI